MYCLELDLAGSPLCSEAYNVTGISDVSTSGLGQTLVAGVAAGDPDFGTGPLFTGPFYLAFFP